jgi:hypothetical protein
MINDKTPSLILKIDGHPVYTAYPGKEFKIGRHKDNDILIPHPTVSRFHATIKWEGRFPFISDCQSTAGLKVDDLFVSYQHLIKNHEIKLGDVKIKASYIQKESHIPTQILNPNNPDPAVLPKLTDSNNAVLFIESDRENIEGSFETTDSFHKILKCLEDSKRTGTLTIKTEIDAKIVFALGKIKLVNCGSHQGLPALQQICNFTRGTYRFSTEFDVAATKLNESIHVYLRNLRIATTKRTKRP